MYIIKIFLKEALQENENHSWQQSLDIVKLAECFYFEFQ